MKKWIKYLVIILVIIEGYLTYAWINDGIVEKRDTQEYCKNKCIFSQTSYFWEFSEEGPSKGFTTQEECINYCYRFQMGFIAALSNIFSK